MRRIGLLIIVLAALASCAGEPGKKEPAATTDTAVTAPADTGTVEVTP